MMYETPVIEYGYKEEAKQYKRKAPQKYFWFNELRWSRKALADHLGCSSTRVEKVLKAKKKLEEDRRKALNVALNSSIKPVASSLGVEATHSTKKRIKRRKMPKAKKLVVAECDRAGITFSTFYTRWRRGVEYRMCFLSQRDYALTRKQYNVTDKNGGLHVCAYLSEVADIAGGAVGSLHPVVEKARNAGESWVLYKGIKVQEILKG